MLGEGSGRSYGIFERGQDLRDKMERLIVRLDAVGKNLNN